MSQRSQLWMRWTGQGHGHGHGHGHVQLLQKPPNSSLEAEFRLQISHISINEHRGVNRVLAARGERSSPLELTPCVGDSDRVAVSFELATAGSERGSFVLRIRNARTRLHMGAWAVPQLLGGGAGCSPILRRSRTN